MYQIAMEIALHDRSVARTLGVLMADMARMRGMQGQIIQGFQQMRLAVIGLGSVFAGGALLGGMMKLSEHADKLLHTMKQMENQGWASTKPWERLQATFSHTPITTNLQKAHELAFQLSGKYPTIGYEQALGIVKEAAPIVGSRPEALGLTEDLTRFAVAIQGASEGRGISLDSQLRDTLKALELKGALMDPKTGELSLPLFRSYLTGMGRTITATSGFIKPSDYLQFMKTAKASGMQMDEDFFLNIAPTLMQEMGAMRAGTGMMSVFQALVGQQVTKRAAGVLQQAGVFKEPLEFGREGLTPLKYGDLLNSQEAQQNLYNWMGDRLIDLELKHGGKLSRTDIIQEMAQWFGNRNAQAIADVLMTQRAKIERDRRLYSEAMSPTDSIASLYSRGSADPLIAHTSAVTQFERAMISIAEAMAPLRAEVLWAFSDFFTKVGNFAHANPDAIMQIAKGLGILGVALIGGGAIALMAALGPAGWLAAGIIGLGTVLALHGSAIQSWLDSAYKGEKGFMAFLASLPVKAIEGTISLLEKLGTGIAWFVNKISSIKLPEWLVGSGKSVAPEGSIGTEGPAPWEGLQKQSYTGGSNQQLLHKLNWQSGQSGGPKVQHIHNIYLNGRQIAQAFSESLSRASEHVTRAPAYDGTGLYTDPSIGLIGT